MANKFRGEADLEFTREVNDKEEPAKFKFVFDANALCAIEDITDLDMGGFLEKLSDPKKLQFRMVRAFVWGACQKHHPDMTIEEAGDIISDAGLEVVVETMRKAVSGAMPKVKEGAPGEAKAKPGHGTGKKR